MMKYLVTGGTGSFGRAFVKYILDETKDHVTVFSRDELKQWEMRAELKSKRLDFIIGDVRDGVSVFSAVLGHDRVVHAAALKHVHTGEVFPWEAVQTNIMGTNNVATACKDAGVDMVFLSTDKAVAPVNNYGCTKMAAMAIAKVNGARIVLYGNVFGSRGSVLHIFKQEAEKGGVFSITDKRMTRFVITLDQAVEVVMKAFEAEPGSVTIPDIPAMRIVDLAKAFDPDCTFREIGMFPGEKLHEVLQLDPYIGSDTAPKLTIDEIRRLIDEHVT